MKKLALFVAVLALVFGGCAKKAENAQTPATTDTTAVAAAVVDTTKKAEAAVADTTKKSTAAVLAEPPAPAKK